MGSVGDKEATARGAGWYALTETSLARLTRENWGFKIKDVDGRKKDTGVQDAMDELVAFLANTAPIDMRTPLAINNNTGGNSALNIYNSPQNYDNGITVNNNGTGDYISIGPTNVTFGNTNTGDSLTMNNLFQTVRNEGDNSYPINVTTAIDINNVITIIGGPGGGGDGRGGCQNLLRQFILEADIRSRGNPNPVNGTITNFNPDTNAREGGRTYPLKTDLVRGTATAGDTILAYYDCGESEWYAIANHNEGWSGTQDVLYSFNTPTAVINADCTITLTYPEGYHNTYINGLLTEVTKNGVEQPSTEPPGGA